MQVKRYKFIADICQQIEEQAAPNAKRINGAAVVIEVELNDDEWFSFLAVINLTEEQKELYERGLLNTIPFRKMVLLRHAQKQPEGILSGKSNDKTEGTLKLKN
jgi:hypothetical protein